MASHRPPSVYTDVEALAGQIGIGGSPGSQPRRRLRLLGTRGQPTVLLVAFALFVTTGGFLALSVVDFFRGRSTIAAAFHHARGPASSERERAVIARDFAPRGVARQVSRLEGLVPPNARIAALSLNGERRLSAFVVRRSGAAAYEADTLRAIPFPWISRRRAAAPGLALADLDPAAPVRIVTAIAALPGFTPDGVSSLALERDPRAGGALRWTATWAFEQNAVFTADAAGRHVRRESRTAGAPS